MSSDNNLSERLAFIKLNEASRAALGAAAPTIKAALPGVLEAFYAQIRRFPAVAGLFSDERHMSAARGAQESHWGQISSGRYDARYVESVQRIGAVHARIGLEPRWYIGGYAMVLSGLVRALVDEDARRQRRWTRKPAEDSLGERLEAVTKAALLDMDIVISLYLEAADAARAEAEAQRAEAERHQAHVVKATAAGLSALAAGDLTYRINDAFPGGYEALRVDFNDAMQKLQDALQVITVNSEGMTSGSQEISQAADDLSRRTEQQAATLEETSAALEEITVTVRRTAEAADEANRSVGSAREDAERSGKVVEEAVEAMGGIARSSREIGQIIGVIDEIAFQTNLLALNAGVEAARAGDAGRGFAVVASEVRALAQRSAQAAKEIKTLISTSAQQVDQGVTLVGNTGDALGRISVQVQQISGLVAEIAASAQEQSTGLVQVNTAVGQMDQMTQQNAAMVEQSTAASHTLAREAGELSGLIARFRIGEDVRGGPQRRKAPAKRLRVVGSAAVREDAWQEL
jgi:methyl-accepting chemotaxis protein